MQPDEAKGRKLPPMLLALQGADCILSIAARVGGPRGLRSALSKPEPGTEVTEPMIEVAMQHAEAARSISDPAARRVVALAMQTGGRCRPVHTQRDIERALGVPRTTVRRLLQKGLDEVAAILATKEAQLAA